MVIRRLCLLLSPVDIYVAFANILCKADPLLSEREGEESDREKSKEIESSSKQIALEGEAATETSPTGSRSSSRRPQPPTKNIEFLSMIVQTLNLILLTSPELFKIRELLRGERESVLMIEASAGDLSGTDTDAEGSPTKAGRERNQRSVLGKDAITGEQLFLELYPCWSFNPVATFSLCLLAHKYRHASEIVIVFGEIEVRKKRPSYFIYSFVLRFSAL